MTKWVFSEYTVETIMTVKIMIKTPIQYNNKIIIHREHIGMLILAFSSTMLCLRAASMTVDSVWSLCLQDEANCSLEVAVACVSNMVGYVAGPPRTGRTQAAHHGWRVPSGRRPAFVSSQVQCGAVVLSEIWAVWWYHDHTEFQLELWMMDDEPSAWEGFFSACLL